MVDTLGRTILIMEDSRKQIIKLLNETKEESIQSSLMDEILRIDYSVEKLELQRKLLQLPNRHSNKQN